jgi:hypothetical protein
MIDLAKWRAKADAKCMVILHPLELTEFLDEIGTLRIRCEELETENEQGREAIIELDNLRADLP